MTSTGVVQCRCFVSDTSLNPPDGCSFNFELVWQLGSSSAQAGAPINTDAKHIFNDYGVVVANTVDLRTLARSNLVVTSNTRRYDSVPAGKAVAEG